MLLNRESDLATGANRLVPFDMDAVLHVATAVHLGTTRFLTFDSRQRNPARHAGLTVER